MEMIIEFGEAITPSGIAVLKHFNCPIKDKAYFENPCTKEIRQIQEYKEETGKLFESHFFHKLKGKLSHLPIEKITWNQLKEKVKKDVKSLDNIKDILVEIFGNDKAYLIYDEASRGIPLNKENLSLELNLEEERLEQLKTLIEKRKENCPSRNSYVYLDGLLIEKENGNLTLKVLELKSSKVVKENHIFQVLWYVVGLNNCFKDIKNVVVSQNFYIITSSLSEDFSINTININSAENALTAIIKEILERIENFTTNIPPVRSVCSSCNLIENCMKKSMEIKSPYIYKSIKNDTYFLIEKGLINCQKIMENIEDLKEDILVKPFITEYSLISDYGFYSIDLGSYPVSRGKLDFYYKPLVKIGITVIPNPVTFVPIAFSLSAALGKEAQPLFQKKLQQAGIKGNIINNEVFYSVLIFPKEPVNQKKYEKFLLDFLVSMLKVIDEIDKPSLLFYFDGESKASISSFLHKKMHETIRKKVINNKLYEDLASIYRLLSSSDNLEMEGYKNVGGILDKILIHSKCFTNEPYCYRLIGLRSLNNQSGKIDLDKITSNIIFFSDKEEIIKIELVLDDIDVLDIQKEFYDPIKPLLNFEKIGDKYFEYKGNQEFVFKEGSNGLIKYLSFINWELARLFREY